MAGGNQMAEDKKTKLVWDSYSESLLKEAFDFSERYKEHMSKCKTERECVKDFIEKAEQNGYKNLNDVISKKVSLKSGDKIYANNKNKMIVLFNIGTEPFEKGLRILGAHIDSPRIDLKQNPLYEDSDFAMFKTHYYGGIKKYQWVASPLALHGVVIKKDGTALDIVIGEDESDPVLGISDLLPHLGKEQRDKKLFEAFTGEDLNVCVGSMPAKKVEGEQKERVKSNILNILKEKYDIENEDFISAEFEIVPAGKARDFGIDRSMIMAYGQDDRVCSFTSFEAMMRVNTPDKTCVTLLVDKEEIGSVGATGMKSRYFENVLAEIMELAGDYSELKLRRTLANSKMLSSDVSAGYDPNYPGVYEKNNTAFFGKGIAFSKFTGAGGKGGSNDASPEFIAQLRTIMEKHDVKWQMVELGKVDAGGGGTIAYILAEYGMDVIDAGVALHSMHAPWEVASKADIYEAVRAYVAFLMEV